MVVGLITNVRYLSSALTTQIIHHKLQGLHPRTLDTTNNLNYVEPAYSEEDKLESLATGKAGEKKEEVSKPNFVNLYGPTTTFEPVLDVSSP